MQSKPSAMLRRNIPRRSLRIRDQCTRSSRNTTLNGLPAELLKHIASFLWPSSAAALTIATRSIFSKLGTEFLWIINQEKPLPYTRWLGSDVMENPSHVSVRLQREMFLILLERDLPGMFYCYHCENLHEARMMVSDKKRECAIATLVELSRTQRLRTSLQMSGIWLFG